MNQSAHSNPSNTTANPFALGGIKSQIVKWLIRRISKIDKLEDVYDHWLQQSSIDDKDLDDFLSCCLAYMRISWTLSNEQKLANTPKKGPVVFVANHPLGGLEGMILTLVLSRIRPDLKVLTNELLSEIPEFSDTFVGVDVLNTDRAQYNSRSIREVSRHLSGGGALLVFPAGTVSAIRLPSLRISDTNWNPMTTRMARRHNAPVMPIYVGGRNSLAFYFSAFIHKRLRTLLLPRAMVNKAGDYIHLRIGDLIESKDLRRLGNDEVATQFVRLCCEVLAAEKKDEPDKLKLSHQNIRNDACAEAVAEQVALLEPYCLLRQDNFSIYCAPYNRLGLAMEQLSIARESTFRAANEGTGKEIDSDRFDRNYQHLFLWDSRKQKIGGGYRLGRTDKIARSAGLDGLYSHSLFDYNKAFLASLGRTIEVGRSFVASDYQKDPAALDLLWKGIGRFVANNPEYHTLFGCVSISREYSALAQSMLTQTFLSHYGAETSITSQVRAREPLRFDATPWSQEQLSQLCDIPILNNLVGRIDKGKGIPTLIRHYLSLNGRFVSFTANPGFNDSLDGFILVDLRKTPQRYLKRYLGEEGMRHFLEIQGEEDSLSAIA